MFSASDVSIIIPVYVNRPEGIPWLIECLDSAVTQGAEVVAYDDGSTFDTEAILSIYNIKAAYSIINKGVSVARNKAAEMATRELIFPLDCDDTLAPGAIEMLARMWKGTPVYPDVAKFGDENVPHYVLLDFDCGNLRKMVGFCSVNVLHSKAQWESLGGWVDNLDFYEDGEYNARLMGTYCAIHCPRPLVNYRIHPQQRTELYKAKSREYANKILDEVRRYDMACATCGGKRNNRRAFTPPNNQQQPTDFAKVADANVPTEFEGKVLAHYVGGRGRGSHYYNGPTTGFPYRLKFDQVLYADPADCKDDDPMDQRPWFLIKVKQAAPAVVAPVPEVPQRAPVQTVVERRPVVENLAVDMNVATLEDIQAANINSFQAKRLLDIELTGQRRPKVIKFLQGKIGKS